MKEKQRKEMHIEERWKRVKTLYYERRGFNEARDHRLQIVVQLVYIGNLICEDLGHLFTFPLPITFAFVLVG